MAESDEDFLDSIVTDDESWCYEYDPLTKSQSSVWLSPKVKKPQKVRSVKSKTKTMLIVFFNSKGIIHHKFVPQGKMVNGEFYEGVMKCLICRIHRVRPTLLESGNWFLLHNNAPAHTSLRIHSFVSKNKVVSLDHTPYLPDLAPANYFLFSKFKITMKGKRFQSIPSIEREVTRQLNAIL